jgi:hypothetical protein
VPSNPADSMRGLKYVVTRGKTRVLSGEEVRQLLGPIDTSKFIAHDRAVIELRAYSSAHIGGGSSRRLEIKKNIQNQYCISSKGNLKRACNDSRADVSYLP